jgi:hypothetical protein
MDAIREVIATLYLAAAYAGGPGWLDKANELLAENANDPEMGREAARLLHILSEQSKHLYGAEITLTPPDYSRLQDTLDSASLTARAA